MPGNLTRIAGSATARWSEGETRTGRVRPRRPGTAIPTPQRPAAAPPAAHPGDHARAAELDQFYTSPEIAERVWRSFLRHVGSQGYLMLEPSAGKGAILKRLPQGSIGIEVDPQCDGVIEADFLQTFTWSDRPLAVIGNPPFGRVARKAIDFVNHAATQAEVVAFILPRSFRKAVIVNRLDEHLHLLHEEDLPNDAFTFRSKPKHVPTVFQIWVKRRWPREPRFSGTRHPDFAFVDDPGEADFAVQRIGAQAGLVHLDVTADTSWHYLIKGDVYDVMTRLPFRERARDTAGTPSLAKSEIVELYAEYVAANPRFQPAAPASVREVPTDAPSPPNATAPATPPSPATRRRSSPPKQKRTTL